MSSRSTTSLARGWSDAIDAAVDWRPPHRPTLVVVPHPDDESLSTGGLIAHLRRRGVRVTVLAVTDGGAAYPEQVAPARLEELRRIEQEAAGARLGVPSDSIVRASLPDGAVRRAEAALERLIVEMLGRIRIGHVVAPWIHDHHTDHEACGRAATVAAAVASVPISYGIFWGLQRTPDPDFGTGRLGRLRLDEVELAAKQAAIACHRSQITPDLAPQPVLHPDDLAPTRWSDELFVVDTDTP